MRSKPLCRLAVSLAGLLIAGCSGASAQNGPTPAHPITPEQVKQLLTMTHALERVQQTMHTMIEQQSKIDTVLPADFWSDFQVEIDKVDWVAIATPVYQKHLSTEDADKILAFYSTAVGQRALAATMDISAELQRAGQQKGREIGVMVGQRHAAEIEQRMQQQRQMNAGEPPSTPTKPANGAEQPK